MSVTNNELEQKRRDKSDILSTILFAELLKIAKKKNRTEKDFSKIAEIEAIAEIVFSSI